MSDSSGDDHRTATSDVLAGSQWQIVAIDGVEVIHPEELYVGFGHDGRVTGSTGVNRFTASYSVNDRYLDIGPMALTRRAGPDDLMAQEPKVVGALAGICPYRLDPLRLAIDGPLGSVELVSTDHRPAVETRSEGPQA